jgi:hypothetical protein
MGCIEVVRERRGQYRGLQAARASFGGNRQMGEPTDEAEASAAGGGPDLQFLQNQVDFPRILRSNTHGWDTPPVRLEPEHEGLTAPLRSHLLLRAGNGGSILSKSTPRARRRGLPRKHAERPPSRAMQIERRTH